MKHNEEAVVFECGGQSLIGIIHGSGVAATGVLVVVGGPQYRIGSHRQFLLLARYLSANNVPVMRFDCRGMGDAGGDIRTFEDVQNDIRAAIDVFLKNSPGLQSVILWGLCDAASASIFYGHTDVRVKGMILLNPWVRTEVGQAKAYLRHYYVQRLFDKEMWRNIVCGKFRLRDSLTSLLEHIKKSRRTLVQNNDLPNSDNADQRSYAETSLPERMHKGIESFKNQIGIIISGDDLTAAEFEDMIRVSKSWQKLLHAKSVEFEYLPDANHTFSKQVWRDQVAKHSLAWALRMGSNP